MSDFTALTDSFATRVKELNKNATVAYEYILAEKRLSFLTNVGKLDALSPLSVMSRGYSVAQKDGRTVSSVSDVEVGDVITVRVSDGSIQSVVESKTLK